ncbi:MAG: Tol-Pal system protein TolB, partial [Acetobacteraceae bacterium]
MQNSRFGRRTLLAGSAAFLMTPVVASSQSAPAAGGATGSGQSAVIDVNRAQVEPIPIAIPVFASDGNKAGELASGIAGVITNDLGGCGLFRPLDPS